MFRFLAFLWLAAGLAAAPLSVIVSIVPQAYFMEAIGGKLVRTEVMIPPTASPVLYEPRVSQMMQVAKADLYFAIGVPFERAWLPRFAKQNPAMKVIDVSRGIAKRSMEHHAHGEGPGHDEHEHEENKKAGEDPHIWLSPRTAAQMAKNIASALQREDPENAAVYRANLAQFLESAAKLDRRLEAIFSACPAKTIMVFHPSWGYFCDAYGLQQIAIEQEGKEPTLGELAKLAETARVHRVRTLFVQPQFDRRAADILAASLGVGVRIADPMAVDWDANLLGFAHAICGERPNE